MIEKIMNVLGEPLGKFSTYISTNKYTSSIISGITVTIPFTIVGGLATLIIAAPDPATLGEGNIFRGVLEIWSRIAQGGLGTFAGFVNNISMGLLAVYALLAITYALAEQFKMDKMTNCITSLALFLMISCTFEEGISMGFLGGRGLFCAMFVSCLSVALTHFLMEKNIKISLPDSVPPNVSAPFEALIPLVANIIVFYLLNAICQLLTGTIIPEFIMNIFKPLLIASDSLGGMLVYAFLMNALWVIGINGGNIVNSVMSAILLVNLAENAEAYAAGQEMTHIFCYSPNTSIMNPGGSGAAIALIIAALIVAKSDHLKSITKLGGPGTIFNISEPIVYGYPIVLNSFLFIPFIVAPLVNTTVFYLLMRIGFIGKMFINVPWVIPDPFQIFLATLDWKAFVVHILLIVLDVFMYLPFVKMYDNHLLKAQGIALEQEKSS